LLSTRDYALNEAFSDDYYPEKPQVARKELGEVSHQLFTSQRNVYLWARKGMGKTFLARQVQKTYPNNIYIPFSSSVADSLSSHLHTTNPYLAGRTPALIQMFIQTLKEHHTKERVLFIFDDLQTLRRPKDFYLFLKVFLERVKSQAEIKPRFLLISQAPYVRMDSLVNSDWPTKEAVESRLQLASITLKPYTTEELFRIMEERITLATKPELIQYDQGALRWFATLILRHGSDVRLGLGLLRGWINSDRSLKSAERTWNSEKQKYWEDQLLTLHPHQAVLLAVISKQNGRLTIPSLYERYKGFCEQVGGHALDYRQIHRLLDGLAEFGYTMQSETTQRGRPTAVWLHESITKDNILDAVKEIVWRDRLR
jgi:Cdc6-like AAA superfamily ATPase